MEATAIAPPKNRPASDEYEREPVPQRALKGPGKFWGMYAGEHAAGTEFMIGPLFLLAGVSLQNIFFGLLFGNLMAVLSWRYVCAPIAIKARFTLYQHLEKIAGKWLVLVYNLANGLLFCFLAGAMITVSATAVGIPFDMPMPTTSDLFPNSALFVIIVIAVGLVIALVASLGYDTVAKFANIASPWMVLVFLACGIVAFKQLGAGSWEELNSIWSESILFAQEGENQSTMGFWSVFIFAWFCNAAMHVGMADLSVFRFARKASSGWATTAGMYVGHYMAWVAAAFMLAAQIKLNQDANPVPGPMASNVAGLAGIVCVIVAGWTTANPTIYRAGLAFQAMVQTVFPNVSRFWTTFAAGLIATAAGAFPAFAWQLLGFVGLYGTILAPMGGVIFFDWYFRKRDATTFQSLVPESSFNLAVLLAWLIPVAPSFYLIVYRGYTAVNFVLPCWLITGLLYQAFSKQTKTA
ncbi:hypothetical protein [Pelagicoccus sp. SDUM812005]|uniref:purine-cytosine permease family protein n=1 Tax=Pelagicoccus sp. SDUM812005 TaxID=3041257 RepID=UPI00280CC2F6|nr:hypothetical protein [Pelagicoccus sp. SDUM812005]MDQ8181145.1 hypothetical protein [Pelagicoccus sp. SDUM812005]